jgi:hypothetical protein
MKLLRNPIVTGILALLAVGVVFVQFGGMKLFRSGTTAPMRATLETPPAPANQLPAPSRVVQEQPASKAIQDGLTSTGSLARGMDHEFAAAHFNTWVTEGRMRDPFLLIQPAMEDSSSGTDTNSPVASWKLKAIWNQTGSRLAVINDGVYRVGDEIQGYKILRIENDEVWFQGPGRRERLGFEATPKIPDGKNTADGFKSDAGELPKDNLKT